MQCETRCCANAVERAHTKSLDANDKLIQTRPHVRHTITSRKRQFVIRKGKSTIILSDYRKELRGPRKRGALGHGAQIRHCWAVTCRKAPATVTWSKPLEIFAVFCYAIKTNNTTIRLKVLQPASAGRADMTELQAHHCMTPEQRTVWVSYRQIRRITSINRNLATDFRFSRNFWFL